MPTRSSNPTRYRVNYRPSRGDPWQLYAETRNLEQANTIASGVKQSGYQAQIVDDLTPAPQPYPDASETSASSYYPTSNWAADYNRYIVPGASYNYGCYGGWNPTTAIDRIPITGGTAAAHGTAATGRATTGTTAGGVATDGLYSSHRNWNNSHADRGTHYASHERHSQAPITCITHSTSRPATIHRAITRGAAREQRFLLHTGARATAVPEPHRRASGRPPIARQDMPRGTCRRGRGGGHGNSPGRNAAGHHGRAHDP